MGLRSEGSNPCLGIRRYRRKGRARFLSDEEIRRLSVRLSAHANGRPQQVAVIRLLLLTGCRKSEILTLRWSDYREGHLFLRDSKTGPRTVWLSQPAQNILDGLDCCSARGLRADRRDKLLKSLDTGGQNCTPNNTQRCWEGVTHLLRCVCPVVGALCQLLPAARHIQASMRTIAHGETSNVGLYSVYI